MTTKAIVIKTAGDPAIAGQIVKGLTAPETRRLRAEMNALRKRDALYWEDRIAEARRKYKRALRPHGRLYGAFWGTIGLIWALYLEHEEKKEGRRAA